MCAWPQGDDGVKDDGIKALRDRCKTRHFEKLWDTYTSAFQDYYRGLPRSEQTRIINKGVVKGSDGHYSNEIMRQYNLEEKHIKAKEKEFGWLSEGKIQEEAETLLGGRANLEAAVKRGAVQVSTQSGIQLFHIPTAQAVLKEKFQQVVGSQGSQAVSEEVHEAMRVQGASMPTPLETSTSSALTSFPSSPSAMSQPSSFQPSSCMASCGPLPLCLSTPSLDAASVASQAEGYL